MGEDERDMTIGELYDIHKELSDLEENVRAGEPVEEIKKELEKPKKEKTYRHFSSCFAGERKIDLDWVEKNTVIIHFNGKKKPWKEQKYTGRLGDFFEKYKLL